jgi:hypothetical protein
MNTIDDFYNKIYKNYCKCSNTSEASCYNDNLNNNINNEDITTCNKISIEYNDLNDYENDIQEYITLFIKLGYIKKGIKLKSPIKTHIKTPRIKITSFDFLENIKEEEDNDKYYISINNKNEVLLNWNNIKELSDENKKAFWFFRKAIVDSIIKYLLQKIIMDYKDNNTVEIYSVGSTKLTSDYDLTIYSDPSITVYIIKYFNIIFDNLFLQHSSDIFDTNIYGKGFIEFKDTDEYVLHHCNGNKQFYYIPNNPNYSDSQLMWSLVKFIDSMNIILGHDIYISTYNYFQEKLKKFYIDQSHFEIAKNVYNHLKNQDYRYQDILENELLIKSKYPLNVPQVIKTTDFISLVNFFGIETYYTRGAFMDVVVNNQVCRKLEIVKLDFIDYFTSIIENTSFFLIHGEKDKYLNRIRDSLKCIIQDKIIITQENNDITIFKVELMNSFDSLIKETENLNGNNGKICSYITDLNITQCIKYKIYEILLKIVFRLLRIYLLSKSDNNVYIPFNSLNLTSLVEKNNNITSLTNGLDNSPLTNSLDISRNNSRNISRNNSINRNSINIRDSINRDSINRDSINRNSTNRSNTNKLMDFL